MLDSNEILRPARFASDCWDFTQTLVVNQSGVCVPAVEACGRGSNDHFNLHSLLQGDQFMLDRR